MSIWLALFDLLSDFRLLCFLPRPLSFSYSSATADIEHFQDEQTNLWANYVLRWTLGSSDPGGSSRVGHMSTQRPGHSPQRTRPSRSGCIVAALGLLLLVAGCATTPREPTEFHRKLVEAFQKESDECIPRSWLVEEVAVEGLSSDRRANADVITMVNSRQADDKVFF